MHLNKYSEYNLKQINFLFIFVLLFATFNTIFSFPIDKLFFLIIITLTFFLNMKLSKDFIPIILVLLLLVSISMLINSIYGYVSFIVVFPVIGIIFVGLNVSNLNYLNLYYALLIHLFIALFFVLFSYFTGKEYFVHFLYDKGLPFLHAPMGFTTTVQSFGSISIGWLLLFLIKKRDMGISLFDKFFVVVCSALILFTFNRATYLNLLVIMLLLNRKIIYFVLISLLGTFLFIPDIISKIIGTTGTLLSRLLFAKGAINEIANGSIIQLIFGFGNNLIIGKESLNLSRGQFLIENGFLQIIHTYGLFSFLLLLTIACIYVIYKKKKNEYSKLNVFVLFYIIFSQFFTSEYYSTSFYIALCCILYFNELMQPKVHLHDKKDY